MSKHTRRFVYRVTLNMVADRALSKGATQRVVPHQVSDGARYVYVRHNPSGPRQQLGSLSPEARRCIHRPDGGQCQAPPPDSPFGSFRWRSHRTGIAGSPCAQMPHAIGINALTRLRHEAEMTRHERASQITYRSRRTTWQVTTRHFRFADV